MAKKKGKSTLARSLGAKGKKAFKTHKKDETTFSTAGDLPPGIENGVAKLVRLEFKQYAKGAFKGKYFFQARAVCVTPVEHGGVKCEGKHTSLGPWPMCDQPKSGSKYNTLEKQTARVLNELRKLGADPENLDLDNIEELCEALLKAGIYTRFRVWVGKKPTKGKYKDVESRPVHEWGGYCDATATDDDEIEEDDDDDTDEEEEEEEEEDEEDDDASEADADEDDDDEDSEDEEDGEDAEDDDSDEGSDDDAEEDEEDEDDVEFDPDDIDSVAKAADNENEEAQTLLSDKAEALDVKGYKKMETWKLVVAAIQKMEKGSGKKRKKKDDASTPETSFQDLGDQADSDEGDEDAIVQLTKAAKKAKLDPDKYDSWTELAEALVENRTEAESDDAEVVPEKDDVWSYKPKGKKKAVDCQIDKVLKKKKIVSLHELDTMKKHKGVPFSKLSQSV